MAPPSPEGVFREVVDELRREDQQLLFPLMGRVNEVAEALGRGVAVDPDYIDEGVRLWNRYVTEVHLQRIERIYGVFLATVRPAGPVAPSASRRLGANLRGGKKTEARVESSLDKYNEIRGTQVRMTERIGVLKGLVAAYRTGEYYSAQMLSSLLRSGAFSDRAWAKYEEEFVLKHLAEHVAAAEEDRIRKEVLASDELRVRVESEVQQFLSRPIPTKPATA